MPKLVADVVASVEKRMQRWDADLETELTTYLEEVIRDICRSYPFWFLKITPGSTFPLAFFADGGGDEVDLAAYTPITGNWLDRGWLYIEPEVSTYKVYSPAVPGPTQDIVSTHWKTTPIQKIDYCLEYSLDGKSVRNVPIYTLDAFCHANKTFYGEGSPTTLIWENVSESSTEVTYFRVHPTPEEPKIYALSYTLMTSPNWTASGNTSNRLIDNYYEAAVAAGMIFAAEWFGDITLHDKWEAKLWGSPNLAKMSKDQRVQGLVAKMKKDTLIKQQSDLKIMPGHAGILNKRATANRQFDWRS